MDGTRSGHSFRWHLTVWGWILMVAAVALVILAIVAPSPGVYIGLIAVVLVWAALLSSSFPSIRGRGMFRRDLGTTDFGQEDAEQYDRGRNFD